MNGEHVISCYVTSLFDKLTFGLVYDLFPGFYVLDNKINENKTKHYLHSMKWIICNI